MGRPRKRAHAEVEASESQHDEQPYPPIVPPFDSTLAMELDLSFLDMDNNDLNFFDLINNNNNSTSVPDPVQFSDPDSATASKKPAWSHDDGGLFYIGDSLGPINFDGPDKDPPLLPEDRHQISQEYVDRILTAEIPEKMPSLSPPPSHSEGTSSHATPTPDAGHNPMTCVPRPAMCGCLSGLYLALDSLQHLPTEVAAAMTVARRGTRTAHDAIQCKICGDPPLQLTIEPKPPSIAAFQTLMMLGAVLPSLSYAYMNILEMVDAEAEKANAERRQLRFDLDSYGGLWGSMTNGFNCTAKDKLDNQALEPTMWRLTVRALLKIDVYGMHANALVETVPGARSAGHGGMHPEDQPGLKDIINMVEDRSRRRHMELDDALAKGLVIKPDNCDYVPGDEPPCMKIINVAKKSMAHLVIP